MTARLAAVRAAVALALLVLPGGATAQTTASLDAGVTRVRYGNEPALSLFAVSPLLQIQRDDDWLAALASISAFEGGGWGARATLAGSRYLAPVLGLTPELSGLADASRAEDGTRTGEALARGRLHWLAATEGLWVGGGLGRADGLNGTQSVRSLELGGWVRHDPLTLLLTLGPEWVGDSVRVIDTDLLARVVSGPAEVAVFGGVRHQRQPFYQADRWGGVSAAWWFNERIAATVAIGSYPGDLAREFGAGRYTTLAVRIATRRPDPPERADQPGFRLLPPLAEPVVAEFITEPSGEGRRRIRVSAPGARSVDIIGDFSDWQPVPMRRTGNGLWEVDVALQPGVHRLNVRVSGGEWGVPPGVPVIRDDFNGVVGLITIE